MNSLIEIKSISLKTINQDYITTFNNLNLNINGVVLGDGLGSHFLAEKGAEICVKELKFLLENFKEPKINYEDLFEKVLKKLKKEADSISEIKKVKSKENILGTTLICVIEYPNKFVIAYVGNGSIWQIRGNFTHFSSQRYLPWSSINLLNPHTIDENGKEALYKYFSLNSTEENIRPTIIEVSKDNQMFGDIFIISTDGLFSPDQTPVAKDKEGGLWISGETKMSMLYETLQGFLKNCSTSKLGDELDGFCNKLIENKLIDDDTSFGVIITQQVINYHNLLNENNTDNDFFIN